MEKDILNKRLEIIEKYKQKCSIDELLNLYNINFSILYNLISPCLEHNINKVSETVKDKISERYLKGISSTKIGVEFGIHHKTISKILNERNIKINQSSSVRKYNINENYFDLIDTDNKAYILGLLYADGYNSESKKMIRLQLQERDKEILEKIKNELNYNGPLKYIKREDKIASNGYTSKNMYCLEIYNAHISKALSNLGLVQNKSLILKFPYHLSDLFYSHFIRGYFDGDGSFCHRYNEKYGFRDLISFTSTQDFCERIKEIINQYSKAKGGGIYDAACHNGKTKVLSFSGANQCRYILDWFYQNADLYINRKYNLYLKFLSMNNS